jgi:integrase
MRCGEIMNLTWAQVDLEERIITVGRAKTASRTGRQIPINNELLDVIRQYRNWYTGQFGAIELGWYVFPFGTPAPKDPTRPVTTVKTVWNNLRQAAGVTCRVHDLRHTALTKMAENGTPEHTMLAIAGHMSRSMLERYSHIRMAAKREAVESIRTVKTIPQKNGQGTKLGTAERLGLIQ